MTLFNWVSKQAKPDANRGADRAEPAQTDASQLQHPMDPRKQQRHARREQLYVSIREAMARSGVLSTGYKFKVLSLDQIGNEFMVMVDLAQGFGAGFDKLSDMEASVIKNAKERFEIVVPTVYWRLTGAAVFASPAPIAARAPVPAPNSRPAVAPRHAMEDDEIAAFNRALLAASSKSRPGPMAETVRLGGRALVYPPLADFAETEMSEGHEPRATPALGKTQYGDLN